MDIVLYAFTAALYAGLAIWAWLQSRARTGSGANATQSSTTARSDDQLWSKLTLLAAWCAHGVLLHETVFPPDHMVFGFAQALSAMLWLGVGLYWVESWFFALGGLRLLLLPTAAWVCVLPLVFPGGHVMTHAANPLFKMHFAIANIAYGLLALAAFHALLMMAVEQRLHAAQRPAHSGFARWWHRFLDALPPLLTLEKLLFRLITVGFICLTLTVFSGILFSEDLFGRAFRWNHKTVFALMSWVMFGGLLAGRYFRGWRGKQALRWVLASFSFLLLAYVGSRFVMEVLLQRGV